MKETALDRCGEYAMEFLRRLKEMKRVLREGNRMPFNGCKESAALRRISLDLTRALADLRQNRD